MSTHPTKNHEPAEHLEKLRQQVAADLEALKEKEVNLNAYEEKLRALVERNELSHSVRSGSNGNTAPELDAAWEKLHRGQTLLEAERRALKGEQLLVREQQAALQLREDEIARREAWIERCAGEIAAVAATTVPANLTRAGRTLTTAPFLAVKQLFTRGN